MNALFVPVYSWVYDRYVAGTKTVEVRTYGPRWNERTVYTGRLVTLSRGYSKTDRLTGSVGRVWKAASISSLEKEAFTAADVADMATRFVWNAQIIAFEVVGLNERTRVPKVFVRSPHGEM